MASIPNVTTPVVINATTAPLVQSDFFLRRVCFVSFGDSTLSIGELRDVESTNYRDILNKTNNELVLRLEQFFAYAGNKKAYVYECGSQPVTPLTDSFDVLKQYAYSVKEDYESFWYSSVYKANFTDTLENLKAWAKQFEGLTDGDYIRFSQQTIVAAAVNTTKAFNIDTSMSGLTYKVYEDSTKTTEATDTLQIDFSAKTVKLLKEMTVNQYYVELFDGQSPVNSDKLIVVNKSSAGAIQTDSFSYAGTAQGYQTWLIQNSKDDNLTSLDEYLSLNNKDWQASRGSNLAETDNSFKAKLTKESLNTALTENSTVFVDYPSAYDEYRVEKGIYSSDYSDKINLIKDQIDDGRQRIYIYALPKQLYYYGGTGKLCQAYSEPSSAIYFAIEVDKDEALGASSKFKQFEGIKSVIAIYNNGIDGYSFAGAVLGRFVSALFDLSASNPATPVNYKAINGFAFTMLSRSKEAELIENSVTFAGELVGNTVIYNGRTQDSRPFDYWYQWDIVAFNLQEAIVSILLQGVNNPNQVIKYDQNGIDTLNAAIKSRLSKMIDYGCITEFCAGLDPATGASIESGYIKAESFSDYVAANPDKYAMEIYDGFSFYLRIGKYIRQLILNISLG